MLDHELLRSLQALGTLLTKSRDIDVSGLTDKQETDINELLSQIIGDAMRIRSRVSR